MADAFVKLCRSGDVELDVADCPDLVPPLAAMAAVRKGTTSIVHAARLRIKESDRLSAVTAVMNALGAHIEELHDGLVIAWLGNAVRRRLGRCLQRPPYCHDGRCGGHALQGTGDD